MGVESDLIRTNKQLLDEVEHDIMRKPNSIIVLLYIFHIIHQSETEAKRSAILFVFNPMGLVTRQTLT